MSDYEDDDSCEYFPEESEDEEHEEVSEEEEEEYEWEEHIPDWEEEMIPLPGERGGPESWCEEETNVEAIPGVDLPCCPPTPPPTPIISNPTIGTGTGVRPTPDPIDSTGTAVRPEPVTSGVGSVQPRSGDTDPATGKPCVKCGPDGKPLTEDCKPTATSCQEKNNCQPSIVNNIYNYCGGQQSNPNSNSTDWRPVPSNTQTCPPSDRPSCPEEVDLPPCPEETPSSNTQTCPPPAVSDPLETCVTEYRRVCRKRDASPTCEPVFSIGTDDQGRACKRRVTTPSTDLTNINPLDPAAMQGTGSIQRPPAATTRLLEPQLNPKLTPNPNDLWQPIGLDQDFGVDTFEVDPPPPNAELSETQAMLDDIEKNNAYEEDAEVWFSKPTTTAINSRQQYTPGYSITGQTEESIIEGLTALSQAVGSVTNQGVNGNWMTWEGTEWDGVAYDTTDKTKAEICAFLRPTGSLYLIRGIKQLYDTKQPFANEASPTSGEINAWNIEVIRHFRALLGVNRTVENNARLYLEARWATERKNTTSWDASYPPTGSIGDAYGPCFSGGTGVDTAGGHCGAAFFPNETDRNTYINAAPYQGNTISYPELNGYTSRHSLSEGISAVNANIPWSIKLATIIGAFICNEGLTGHAGPFVNENARQFFGCAWWWDGSSSTATFRGKWR